MPRPDQAEADDFPGSYHPGEPLPALEATERDSQSAWALFQALQDGTHDGFPETERSEVRLPRRRRFKPLTVEEVIFEARRGNRVAPLPSHWQKLHDLLAEITRQHPPVPVDVTAWRNTPPLDMRSRLRAQIEWAAQRDALEPVFAFLRELPEDRWHHMGG